MLLPSLRTHLSFPQHKLQQSSPQVPRPGYIAHAPRPPQVQPQEQDGHTAAADRCGHFAPSEGQLPQVALGSG